MKKCHMRHRIVRMTICIVKGKDLANQGSVKVFSAASDNIQIQSNFVSRCQRNSYINYLISNTKQSKISQELARVTTV